MCWQNTVLIAYGNTKNLTVRLNDTGAVLQPSGYCVCVCVCVSRIISTRTPIFWSTEAWLLSSCSARPAGPVDRRSSQSPPCPAPCHHHRFVGLPIQQLHKAAGWEARGGGDTTARSHILYKTSQRKKYWNLTQNPGVWKNKGITKTSLRKRWIRTCALL